MSEWSAILTFFLAVKLRNLIFGVGAYRGGANVFNVFNVIRNVCR
jgi:hypothetical protein